LEELQGVPAELKEVAGISATESGAEIAGAAEERQEGDSSSQAGVSAEGSEEGVPS